MEDVVNTPIEWARSIEDVVMPVDVPHIGEQLMSWSAVVMREMIYKSNDFQKLNTCRSEETETTKPR